MLNIIKRNGNVVAYDESKIKNALEKAFVEVDKEVTEGDKRIIDKILGKLYVEDGDNVEKIQDRLEDLLMDCGRKDVARAYVRFRYKRELVRESNTTDETIKELLNGNSDYWNKENSNKNAKLVTTQRDYLAGITSTDITRRFLLPKDVVKAHDDGILHFHDADYFAENCRNNCSLINLEDMLQNGTVINGKMIDKPHRLLTATTIATQIITAVASSQYGGTTITLTHLAPFVRDSYNYYFNKYTKRGCSKEDCVRFATEDLTKEIEDSVQTFNYQVNSMSTTNGQTPFLSVFMYLSEDEEYKEEVAMLTEEFFKQRIVGMKNEVGAYVVQEFPKLLYVLEDCNIKEDGEYYYLSKLAAKCTSKRFVPDYISEKKMKQLKEGNVFGCMGCRSFLSPWKDENGEYKFWGRFNQGVVTLSLPDVALSSGGDFDKFWKLMDERLELCHKALLCRHERLEGTLSDVAPILWQHGAFTRLKKGETIDKTLHGGYSSISLGSAGLYECVKYMTGVSHTDEKGREFGLQIFNMMNEYCEKWAKEDDIGYSLYQSPIESTTYKFAKKLRERFGVIEGITDRDYITNGYHVPVFEKIDAFTKFKFESEFQDLSLGGAISYIECADLTDNIEAILQVMKYIYETIMYAEFNIRSADYCQECGYEGEIKLIDEGELVWECPNCGNRNQDTMNVSRRTCGYTGSNYWNKGRTQEIHERYIHLGDTDMEE